MPPVYCELRNRHHDVALGTAEKHTNTSLECMGREHKSPLHHGVDDVDCATTSTGLVLEVVREVTDHSNVNGNKAGSTLAYSHCFPLAKYSSVVTFMMAKCTVASDRMKELGVNGEFSSSDAKDVPHGTMDVLSTAGGCHGPGLLDIMLVTTTGAHENSVPVIFKDCPITGTNDDSISRLSL